MKKTFSFLTTLLLCYSFQAFSKTETYTIDKTHSSVGFQIRHLVISKVNGSFNDFDGTIKYDSKKPQEINIEGIVQTKSIDTNNEKRDQHLRSADFFNVEKNPLITFKSTKIKNFNNNKGILEGKFTMNGITKTIDLDFEIIGTTKDPWGNEKAAFEASAVIPRKEFGLTWNQTLDEGGVLVGEAVTISLNIQATKAQPQKKNDPKNKKTNEKK